MKFTAEPPLPQLKHLHIPFDFETENDGVLSLWNGHKPI
ncbi:unknown [Prevotella sp. CAG:1031]|nr:unknown [Prevotella sp. CAG:1031]